MWGFASRMRAEGVARRGQRARVFAVLIGVSPVPTGTTFTWARFLDNGGRQRATALNGFSVGFLRSLKRNWSKRKNGRHRTLTSCTAKVALRLADTQVRSEHSPALQHMRGNVKLMRLAVLCNAFDMRTALFSLLCWTLFFYPSRNTILAQPCQHLLLLGYSAQEQNAGPQDRRTGQRRREDW